MSKHGVFSGPYFPVFGLNTELYGVNFRIQSEYSHSVQIPENTDQKKLHIWTLFTQCYFTKNILKFKTFESITKHAEQNPELPHHLSKVFCGTVTPDFDVAKAADMRQSPFFTRAPPNSFLFYFLVTLLINVVKVFQQYQSMRLFGRKLSGSSILIKNHFKDIQAIYLESWTKHRSRKL